LMLVSVSERTGEIGLLRALGAAKGQVLSLFLVEATLLSVIGGALGIVSGYALAAGVRAIWPSFPAHPPGWAVATGVIVAIGVGLGFGAIPARRAAQLDPKIALAGRRA
jgi:putative ABC transport system permease protein